MSLDIRNKQQDKKYDYYGAAGVIDLVDSYLFDDKLLLIGEDGANLLSRSKNNAIIAEGKFWVNNHAHVLDSTNKEILDYVAFVINTMVLDDYITGSAQPKLSQDNLNKIPIALPPLNEQQRIVAAIETWHSQIDIIDEEKSELDATIQKAKIRILDLALSGRLTSDTSHYGKWPHLPLSEIFHITMGQSPESCHINHIKDGVEFHQGKLHFGHKYLQDSGIYTDNEMKVADAHSLLMCVRAPVGVINITERRICIGRGLCALKLKNPSMPIGYWYYALSSLSRYFEEKSTGSTFKAITMDVIRNTQIRVPPIIEQEAIVRQLEQIDEIVDKILAIK